MPDSGADPQQSGSLLDASGGGLDPSAYLALSPGGRFGGDINNFIGYRTAQNTGGLTTNGNSDPSNIKIPGTYGSALSKLINFLVNDTRGNGIGGASNGGTGQAPGNPLTDGGYPYQAWSGPGAAFGPPGGPLNGLIDQGNPHNVDGVDNPWANLADAPAAPASGGHHDGGGGGGSFSFTPYNGVPFTASFVGMDPTQPFAQSHAPSAVQRLVNPGAAAAPASSTPKGSAGGGGSSASGGGRTGTRIAGAQYGGAPPPVPPGGSTRPDGRIFDVNGRTIYIPGAGGPGGASGGSAGGSVAIGTPGTPKGNIGDIPPLPGGIIHAITGGDPIVSGTPTDRQPRGTDIGILDKSTPGWVHDPTTGIQNTAGMPLGTMPDPHGMTTEQYVDLLHQMGYTQEDIANAIGSYGFGISNPQAGPAAPSFEISGSDPSGGMLVAGHGGGSPANNDNVSYGWGTGPVVGNQGGGGYHFANQGYNGAGDFPGGGGAHGGGGGALDLMNAASLWNSVLGREK